MRLHTRLVLVLMGLSIGLASMLAGALLANLRNSIGAEGASTLALMNAVMQVDGWQSGALHPLQRLAEIDAVRHVSLSDQLGRPFPAKVGEVQRPRVPEWFEKALAIQQPATHEAMALQAVDGRTWYLVADPRDEIAEAWEDFVDSCVFLALLLGGLHVGSWWVLRRELRPLNRLSNAMQAVGAGQLSTAELSATSQELQVVCSGFAAMTRSLEQGRVVNLELTRRLLDLQEQERRSIARELHDEFAQLLTAIAVSAHLLSLRTKGDVQAVQCVDDIVQAVTELQLRIRQQLANLRPAVLDTLGLQPALADLLREFERRHPHIKVVTRLDPALQVNDEQSIALYRIAQEALTNIVRHSGASCCWVQLETTGSHASGASEELRLLIRDNGTAVDHIPWDGGGMGLLGIRERVAALGGTCRVHKSCDAGIEVDVRLHARGQVS